MKDALLLGFPWTVVVGGKYDANRIEVRVRKTGETLFVSREQLLAMIEKSSAQ